MTNLQQLLISAKALAERAHEPARRQSVKADVRTYNESYQPFEEHPAVANAVNAVTNLMLAIATCDTLECRNKLAVALSEAVEAVRQERAYHMVAGKTPDELNRWWTREANA